MIATQPITNDNLTPAQTFIAEWRGAGPVDGAGLPRWMVIANDDGTPTPQFISLSRKAFSLTPAIGLRADHAIINLNVPGALDGTPTTVMQNAWLAWTS